LIVHENALTTSNIFDRFKSISLSNDFCSFPLKQFNLHQISEDIFIPL